MMAAHKLRQHGGLLLALLLLSVTGVLSACERQLQDSGINLLPGSDAEEVGQGETGIVDAPTSEAAEPAETEPLDEDQPISGIPADDPAPLPGAAEVAATEESPRPAADEPEATEEAAPEVTEAATAEATEEAVEATAEPDAEAPEEAEVTETATADAEEAETAETEAAEEAAAEETAAEAAAETAQAPAAQERIHVVQTGENLYRIGLQYGISWLALATHNNLPNANAIYVGQELRIPTESGGTPTPTPAPAETTYVVQAGDTLHRIGQLFNLSWVTIAQANGLVNPNHILVGQQLKIPAGGVTPNPQLTHTVQPRETLFLISLRYGVPWMSIASANNLSAPYMIYPGQTLVIPGSTQ
jgi:LysM repeat protein